MNTKNNVSQRLKNVIKLLKTIEAEKSIAVNRERLRAEVFALEGIFRLVLKQHDKDQPELTKYLGILKNIEDQVGKYSFSVETAQVVKNLFNGKKTATMARESSEGVIVAEKVLVKHMLKEKWSAQLEEVLKFTQSYSWPNKTKKFLKKALKNELKKLKVKIKDQLLPIISVPEYSHLQLEDGVHELRRNIRWISIYIQAYKDKFYLSEVPKKLSSYEKSLIKKHKNSPFSQLTGDDNQVKLNRIAYYDLSEMIKTIGDLKSLGEQAYWIEERWGVSHDAFEQSIEKKALNLVTHIIESNMLGNIL